MYNLRYHVASLVAAFLFLSVGLLLGTVVAERGTLDTQRDSLISSLRLEFEDLSAENTALTSENENQTAFIDDTMPLLVSAQLDNQYVVVISNAGRADGVSPVSDAILSAGGMPVVVTMREPGYGLSDPLVSQVATAYVDVDPADDEAFANAVAQELAREWSTPGSPRMLTEALVGAEVLSVTEFPPGVAAASIVTMAAWEGEPDAIGIATAEAMSQAGLRAVGVEMSSNPTGVASAAAGSGLSAVEDAGTPEGDFSLVMVLAGKASGYFGPSAEAGARYPVVSPGTQAQ